MLRVDSNWHGLGKGADLLVGVGGTLQEEVGEDHARGEAVDTHARCLTCRLGFQRPEQMRNACSMACDTHSHLMSSRQESYASSPVSAPIDLVSKDSLAAHAPGLSSRLCYDRTPKSARAPTPV